MGGSFPGAGQDFRAPSSILLAGTRGDMGPVMHQQSGCLVQHKAGRAPIQPGSIAWMAGSLGLTLTSTPPRNEGGIGGPQRPRGGNITPKIVHHHLGGNFLLVKVYHRKLFLHATCDRSWCEPSFENRKGLGNVSLAIYSVHICHVRYWIHEVALDFPSHHLCSDEWSDASERRYDAVMATFPWTTGHDLASYPRYNE